MQAAVYCRLLLLCSVEGKSLFTIHHTNAHSIPFTAAARTSVYRGLGHSWAECRSSFHIPPHQRLVIEQVKPRLPPSVVRSRLPPAEAVGSHGGQRASHGLKEKNIVL